MIPAAGKWLNWNNRKWNVYMVRICALLPPTGLECAARLHTSELCSLFQCFAKIYSSPTFPELFHKRKENPHIQKLIVLTFCCAAAFSTHFLVCVTAAACVPGVLRACSRRVAANYRLAGKRGSADASVPPQIADYNLFVYAWSLYLHAGCKCESQWNAQEKDDVTLSS